MGGNVLHGKRILVVEDDHLIAADLMQGLEALGAEVVGPYGRVSEALKRVQNGAPVEGAVLDIQVGGELVYRLVDKLKGSGVPIVFATGTDAREIPQRYRDVRRYPKPYSVDEVARSFATRH